MLNHDLRHFVTTLNSSEYCDTVNILQEGGVQKVIAAIDNSHVETVFKIRELLSVFSQIAGCPSFHQASSLSLINQRILQYAMADMQATEKALDHDVLRFNPSIKELVFQIKCLKMAFPSPGARRGWEINLTCFFPFPPHFQAGDPIPRPLNLLETEDVRLLSHYVFYRTKGNAEAALEVYLKCLSQAVCSTSHLSATYVSHFKQSIFHIARENPRAAQSALLNNVYDDERLVGTIAKIKDIVYVKPADRRYGSYLYLAVAVSLHIVGIMGLLSQRHQDVDRKYILALMAYLLGVGMLLFPYTKVTPINSF